MTWYVLFSVFFLGLPIGLASLVLTARITALDCHTQFGPCPSDIVQSFQPLIGQPLFSPDVSTSHPTVLSLATSVVLPSTLRLSLSLRQPLGVVMDSTSTLYQVDTAGYVLAASPVTTTQPRLHVDQPITPGQTLPTPTVLALHLLAHTTSAGIIQGYLSNNLLVFYLNSIQILIDTEHLSTTTVSSLQAVLARSKINSQIPKKIDLRYQNPIVVY